MAAELSRRRPAAAGFSLRRAFAMLLLPLSLLPIVLLAPSLARAPETLAVRLERMVLPTQHPARSAPSQPPRYPPGASRLERDIFAPVARILTPQVGVSALAEHQTRAEKVHAPVVLITGEPEGGAR